MSVIKMTSTSGVYVSGTTYRLRAREAQALLAAGTATVNAVKTAANTDIKRGKP